MATYYSNGKLMLTGEYLVLKGAVSLALPVKYGQSLEIHESPGNCNLLFETEVNGKSWFSAEYNPHTFEIFETTNIQTATYVQRLLYFAKNLNNDFLSNDREVKVVTCINFNIEWGLGSSSSLISNIALWANVDPFLLNNSVSKGSGYDIACARSQSPILYQIENGEPRVEEVRLPEVFVQHAYFIYLGSKQSTEQSIQSFEMLKHPTDKEIFEISDIAHGFVSVNSVDELIRLSELHEYLISEIIGYQPVKEKLFNDFQGSVKSLGAWGGDFCMAVTIENFDYVKQYFGKKGYQTIFSFNEIALTIKNQ
jgi:mevalonate kinase